MNDFTVEQSTILFILHAISYAFFLLCCWPVTLRYLQYFQQEEYDNTRFLTWWLQTRSFEKRTVLLSLLTMLLVWFFFQPTQLQFIAHPLVWAGLLTFIALAAWSNLLHKSKKPLVMTARAKRIFITALIKQGLEFIIVHYLVILLLDYALYNQFITPTQNPAIYTYLLILSFLFLLALYIFITPLSVLVANQLLRPIENRTQQRYLHEAKEILRKHKPQIIGITGSYGKTSVKHILAHMLDFYTPTLATPGSVNTPMGITRIIRERLKQDHEFFIVEMGAYGMGSIQRICDLTPPNAAIVTAVGLAHLERFRSIEAVRLAKSELPKAVPQDGLVILNGDDPYCRAMLNDIQAPVYLYGENIEQEPVHCRIHKTELKEEGTSIEFTYDEKDYKATIPLYGIHQAQNAVAAFLAAVKLGVPVVTALSAMKSIPPIPHRLVVERDPNGITWIDDAYNSNPVGFQNALEVLRVLPGKRKILVTPGMVELGDKNAEEHEKIGAKAAGICDLVCHVAPHRTPSFRQGLLKKQFLSENLYTFPSLLDTREWLNQQVRSGDVILFENDLPDVLETQSAFRLF